eukprot:6889466-Alexandrium_andersonii.AAC.1
MRCVVETDTQHHQTAMRKHCASTWATSKDADAAIRLSVVNDTSDKRSLQRKCNGQAMLKTSLCTGCWGNF